MTIRLPRLPFNWREQPELFERYWDEAMNQIEGTLNSILVLPIIQTQLAAAATAAATADGKAVAAQTTANTAVTNAAAAQTTANNVSLTQNSVNSYVSPLAILSSATTAGGVATITIINHTRFYGNGTSNAVTGNTVGALAASTSYWIYYDDPTLAGGAVTYAATTVYATAYANGAMPNRLVVGAITTAAASGSSTGSGKPPPGYAIP